MVTYNYLNYKIYKPLAGLMNKRRDKVKYMILLMKNTTYKTIRYHYKLSRKDKIWNTDDTNCWDGYAAAKNSHTLLIGMQIGTAILKDSLVSSYKTKHTLSMGSSNQAFWY